MKTAQEIINETMKEDKNRFGSEGFTKTFYPTIWEQRKADFNLTKCLGELEK